MGYCSKSFIVYTPLYPKNRRRRVHNNIVHRFVYGDVSRSVIKKIKNTILARQPEVAR